MTVKKIKYLSAGGGCYIYAFIYMPTGEAKGIVQISHGMSEHVGRYADFAGYLTENGYIVCANDHLGHGLSFNNEYGFMGEKDGYTNMVKDMHKLYRIMCKKHPGLPYFLLGHSMGSFLARFYSVKYGTNLSGIIYSGTGDLGPAAVLGILISKLAIRFGGRRSPGKLFDKITKISYNSRIRPKRTDCDWLSRDNAIVDAFINDKACCFAFTYSGYLDLFTLMEKIRLKSWAKRLPKNIPIYLFSGAEDPVGGYGKGVTALYNKLVKAGCENITLKLYSGGRHEMLNEINRHEVYKDVLNWINSLI